MVLLFKYSLFGFFGSSFPAAAHVHLYLVLCATCTQGSLVTNESQPGIPSIPGGSPKPQVLRGGDVSIWISYECAIFGCFFVVVETEPTRYADSCFSLPCQSNYSIEFKRFC